MLLEVKNIERLIKKIKGKSFKPVVKKPLSNLEIDFLDEFSKELKKVKKIFDYKFKYRTYVEGLNYIRNNFS